MPVAETANLLVKLSLGGNFQSQLGKVNKDLGKFDKNASRAYKAGGQIGTGIQRGAKLAAVGVGILATQIGFGLDQLIELESLTAQSNAVLKSTKGVAGQTADSIRNLAEKYEGLNATIDDKVIQSGENVLLTFTNIRKDAFEPAIAAALDLSVAMKQDLSTSILQVGKALNDPVKGITALRRAGVQLSPQQQKQIKAFVKQGKVLEAQKVILKELNKEFGGSFLAGGATTAGKVAKFGDAIEDIQKSLATAMLPAVSNIADALTTLLADPATLRATEELGTQIGKLFSPANIKAGIGALKEGFSAITAIAGPIADIVGKVVSTFTSLPPDIQKLLVGGFAVNKLTGGLVTNVFGGIAEAIAKSFIKAPLVNVQGAVVNVNGGVPGLPGGGGINPVAAGAGLSGAAALGIAGLGVTAAIVGAVNSPLWVKNTTVATKLEQQGLTQAERAAQLYYTASAAEQAQMRKHIGVLPTRKDFESGNAKLKTSLSHKFDEQKAKADLIKAQAQRTAAAVKDADSTISGKVAGTTIATRAGAASVAAAVRASRPIINVDVQISATSITKVSTKVNRYGSPASSRDKNNGSGLGPGGA